ncbi:MAG: bifunctional oligoribonuclease/PAP phosphatase NrnA, partial [Clostridiales bacterium]|nr:bifunctional oligoribonuclease/PAP phosphatase NrnA [Clostridiales bacterium]
CEVIYSLFADSGLMDKPMATMLYTGLSTDTGHFMHSNTTPEVFRIASELSAYGIDISAVNHGIYKNKSLSRIKLTARALSGIELFENGRIALMTITRDDMAECGCLNVFSFLVQ